MLYLTLEKKQTKREKKEYIYFGEEIRKNKIKNSFCKHSYVQEV